MGQFFGDFGADFGEDYDIENAYNLDEDLFFTARGKRKQNQLKYGCDENQCETISDPCDPNAVCVNKCAGYTCQCFVGFIKEGKKCIEICDENEESCSL